MEHVCTQVNLRQLIASSSVLDRTCVLNGHFVDLNHLGTHICECRTMNLRHLPCHGYSDRNLHLASVHERPDENIDIGQDVRIDGGVAFHQDSYEGSLDQMRHFDLILGEALTLLSARY